MKKILSAPKRAIRRMYDWTIKWSRTSYAPYALFAIAFAESSFFPIPPDVLLIAMTVADPFKWLRNAIICTVGSVTGGVLGYFIGLFLYETVGVPIVEFYHLQEHMKTVERLYQDNAFLAVFTAAFTPIPYKVFTIAGGVFHISLVTLVLASVCGRAGRFFAVAGMLRLFGEKISNAIEKYFDLFSLLFLALLIAGFYMVRFLK